MRADPQPIDKLTLLQANDDFRSWTSLDDKRVCVLCDRTFSGHEVLVSLAGLNHQLRCPTRGCPSQIHQWVYAGNPLISEQAYADWWRALAEPSKQSSAQAI